MINAVIKKLSNNLTVVMDYIPHVQTASLGLWSGIGSKVESVEHSGICHFLEHMVFKGTKTRKTQEISNEIESRGGFLNAYTSKEKTAWYAKVLSADVPVAVDIIFDIIQNSLFLTEELEKERGVIIEEIKMYLDSPQDIVYNLYDEIAFKDSPIARPIIGTKQTVSSFTSNDFFNHLSKYYYPSNMVLAISGNFVEAQFLEAAEKFSANWKDKSAKLPNIVANYSGQSQVYVKDSLEQANLIYGLQGYSYKDDNYVKLRVLNNILGVGMSSKLWLKIREEKGLAYSVDSYLNSFSNAGAFCVGVGCDVKNINLVIQLINNELNNATITEQELQKAKNQLKSSVIMSLESTFSRCNKIATNMLDFGEVKSLDTYVKDIDAVTLDNVKNELTKLLESKASIAVVAPQEINLSV